MPIPENLKPAIQAGIKSGQLRTNDDVRAFIAQSFAQPQQTPTSQGGVQVGTDFFGSLGAGLRRSVSGLALGDELPGEFDPEGFGANVGFGIGQIIGDLPATIPGAIAGGFAGPVGVGAGALGLAGLAREAIRQSKDVDEQTFTQELGEVLKTGGTEAIIGGATGGLGSLAGKGLKVVGRKVFPSLAAKAARKTAEVQAVEAARIPGGAAASVAAKAINKVIRFRPVRTQALSELRSRQTAKVGKEFLKPGGTTLEEVALSKGKLFGAAKGEALTPELPIKGITDKVQVDLYNAVRDPKNLAKFQTFESLNAVEALDKMFVTPQLLQEGEVKLLGRMFGKELEGALKNALVCATKAPLNCFGLPAAKTTPCRNAPDIS